MVGFWTYSEEPKEFANGLNVALAVEEKERKREKSRMTPRILA